MAGGAGGGGAGDVRRLQDVAVMRHGDRIDHFEPLWPLHAERPWDPPLIDDGLIRAWTTGKRLRAAGFPIHRVFVSPFLRCRQTAAEVVKALCAVVDDEIRLVSMETSHDVVIDPSRVKVSIEYGLSEMLNSLAIVATSIPEDQIWFPAISELEHIFPKGTFDPSTERIYQEMPKWGESVNETRDRYATVIKALADKYPNENLLMVTHGEGVGVSVSSFLENAEIFDVEYCACTHLQRAIFSDPSQAISAGNFNVLTASGQTGISYTVVPESAE